MKVSVSVILNIIFCILIVILLSKTVSMSRDLLNQKEKTDTIWVDRPFTPEPEFKEPVKPENVTGYRIDTITITDIQLQHDTVFITLEDSTKLQVSTLFLTQYPNTSRLLQLLLSEDKLNLSLQNTLGEVFTEEYKLDLQNCSYNYLENAMTQNRKKFIKKIHPYAELQFRPINTLIDVNLGLKYKTSKTNYEIGLNGFYYPRQSKKLGADIYLKLNYEF